MAVKTEYVLKGIISTHLNHLCITHILFPHFQSFLQVYKSIILLDTLLFSFLQNMKLWPYNIYKSHDTLLD